MLLFHRYDRKTQNKNNTNTVRVFFLGINVVKMIVIMIAALWCFGLLPNTIFKSMQSSKKHDFTVTKNNNHNNRSLNNSLSLSLSQDISSKDQENIGFIRFIEGLEITYQHRDFKSFTTAKKKLKKILQGTNQSFYCQCPMNYPHVNLKDCSINQDYGLFENDQVLEFDHVYPMAKVKKLLLKRAINVINALCKKKVTRDCLRRNLEFFSYFESDMYNIRAAVKKLNRIKSSMWFKFDLIKLSARSSKRCNFKLIQDKVSLPNNVKGDVARIMLYIDHHYKMLNPITDEEKNHFIRWSKLDPITLQEQYLIKSISQIQNDGKIPIPWNATMTK